MTALDLPTSSSLPFARSDASCPRPTPHGEMERTPRVHTQTNGGAPHRKVHLRVGRMGKRYIPLDNRKNVILECTSSSDRGHSPRLHPPPPTTLMGWHYLSPFHHLSAFLPTFRRIGNYGTRINSWIEIKITTLHIPESPFRPKSGGSALGKSVLLVGGVGVGRH